ncbi:MAG: thermonuclease family protein, partial [Deltaproteobacteria bacterium]|nr:thermonuclease family protein [Deltaproteobacteria bacterium]
GQFKVTRVTDGDTIKVTDNGTTSTIRLVGIDAPEKSRKKNEPGQPYSKKSTKYLAGLVLNKTVEIKSYGVGRYGRTLGVVFVLRLNLVVPGLNLKDPESLTITGKEKCRQKQGLQLAA